MMFEADFYMELKDRPVSVIIRIMETIIAQSWLSQT